MRGIFITIDIEGSIQYKQLVNSIVTVVLMMQNRALVNQTSVFVCYFVYVCFVSRTNLDDDLERMCHHHLN